MQQPPATTPHSTRVTLYGQELPFVQLLQCEMPPAAIPLARSIAASLMLCCTQPFFFSRFLFTIIMWNRALATVCCTFCWPHLPKVFRRRQFVNILTCKSSYRCNPVALFMGNFPRSSRGTAETETLLRRPQVPHYPEKRWVWRQERFHQLFHPWICKLPNYYPSQLPDTSLTWWCGCGWHDWWCGWHDCGRNANHVNCS